MNEDVDVRSGLVHRFLIAGDELERGGTVDKGKAGIDLGGGVEIVAKRGDLLKFAREIYARFSRRAFPEGIQNPHILIVGDPVDGFEYYGAAPGDDPDGYLYSRQRALEDGGEECWLAKLNPLHELRPVDQDDVPARPGTSVDLLDEFEATGLDDIDLMDLVQDVADKAASAVNNGGRVRQFAYLVEQMGYPAALAAIRSLAN
jgi:hypothetical protein